MAPRKTMSSASAGLVGTLLLLVGILAEKAYLENNMVYVPWLLTSIAVMLTIRQYSEHRNGVSTRAN